ncbi:unannotated protein [freshwater metagenome]|uniref:Unannotated protein n=1 Tax=freshwater metagenome TaxID=449393 RepID=A0A6J7IX52_9ZZZZ
MHLDGQIVGDQPPLGRPALGDRGEHLEQRVRPGPCVLGVGGRLLVHQLGAVQAQRQAALDVALGGQQHPAHVAVLDDRHRGSGRVLARRRAALRPGAGVLQGVQVAGVAQRRRAQPDADPGLVHHVEHGGQAAVLAADQPADGTGGAAGGVHALAEVEQGVRRPAVAHLVVQPRQHDVVALTQAVPLGQELRDDEQRDALHPGRSARDLGQHQVDDVLAELVVPAGDPHLGAGEPVGAVVLGHGLGGDVGQRGARLRLGQRHRAEPAALGHRPHVGVDLLLAAVGEQ